MPRLLFIVLALFFLSCSPKPKKPHIFYGPDFAIEQTEIEGFECRIYYGRHPQRASYMHLYLDPMQRFLFIDFDTIPKNELIFIWQSKELMNNEKMDYNKPNWKEDLIYEDYNIYLLQRDSLRVWLNVALEPGEFPAQVFLEDPHDTPGVFQKYYFHDLSLQDSTFLFNFAQEIKEGFQ